MADPPPLGEDRRPDSSETAKALEGLLQTHEARVLGVVGLFIGYVCVLMTKIMNFAQMYVGALAVAILTFLLLLLGENFQFKSATWWLRSIIVILLCLVLTSPQLYFAWTVSVTEAEAAAQAALDRRVLRESNKFVPPIINVAPQQGDVRQ
jgi:hypothetical protein